MKENNCKITVFIPTYNRLELLKRAVKSVFECGINVHLHILDNCSNDGTSEWLDNIENNSPISIQITKNASNIGAIPNFSNGFASVRTPYLVPLADDDELAPGFLIKAVDYAEYNMDIIAVVGSRAFKKRNIWTSNWNRNRTTGFVSNKIHIEEFLKYGHYVTWSAILWRTSIIQSNEIFHKSKQFGYAADVYFQFSSFLQGPVYILPIPAATFNVTFGQDSSKVGLDVKSISDFGHLINYITKELTDSSFFDNKSNIKNLLYPTIIGWARFIRYNRNIALANNINIELESTFLQYIETFYPHIGFSEFPFFKELNKINSITYRLKLQFEMAYSKILFYVKKF
jgi:glycosyltransferase involved in cell wall biosynthesis